MRLHNQIIIGLTIMSVFMISLASGRMANIAADLPSPEQPWAENLNSELMEQGHTVPDMADTISGSSRETELLAVLVYTANSWNSTDLPAHQKRLLEKALVKAQEDLANPRIPRRQIQKDYDRLYRIMQQISQTSRMELSIENSKWAVRSGK